MVRIKNLLKSKVFRVISVSMLMTMCMTATAFASTTTDFSVIKNAITSNLDTAEILAIVGSVIATGIGFVVLWFGIRKLVYSALAAFRGGKLKI